MPSLRVLLSVSVVALATLVVTIGWGVALSSRRSADEVRQGLGPKGVEVTSYVSSSACIACHPAEYASFSRTFHRTMTQRASSATVLAPFERRGDDVYAQGHRLVMTTGSHRQQAYWISGDRPGDLRILPYVWLVEDQRLIPRHEAFLTPPDRPIQRVRWSSSCIACHSVAGEPRHDPTQDAFDTRVAELGIACEACHGPGAEHVARHRNPFERRAQRTSERPDPSVVHPKKISPERSAAVCGQCHAYAFPRDVDEWWTRGYSRAFTAGDPLERSRFLLTPGISEDRSAEGVAIETSEDSLFWADGTIRVGGREYNGLVLSPCYEKGQGERKMTCLSCHAMHESEPAAQIAPAARGDAGCVACHGAKEHSHHAAGSPGSACVSCHMPRTSYALLAAVRSHRIESPNAMLTADTGKPNACNLCHLDKSLGWTAKHLAEWYGEPVAEIPADRLDAPEGAVGLLAGDAAVRVLVTYALGSPDAAAPPAFRAQLLGIAATDPYAAIRTVARRGLAALPASARNAPPPLDSKLVREWLAARDTRAVTIAE